MDPSRNLTDPTHQATSAPVLWTTVNTTEAIPGVSTPLNWSFYREAIETGIRGSWVDFGVLRRGDDAVPADPADCFNAMFYGRLATNLDKWRFVADRMPGTSGDTIEQQFFGTVRDGVRSNTVRRRYGIVAVKAPVAAALAVRRIRTLRERIEDWWQAALARCDRGEGKAVLLDAEAMFARAARSHLCASMVASGLHEQLVKLASAADRPGLELQLLTGMGGFEETRMLGDIWAASRGLLSIDAVVRRHGFHGPMEGEISSASWREDPAPLRALVDRYRSLDDGQSPAQRERRRTQERTRAERELYAALPSGRRPVIASLLRLAAIYIPLREVGRAIFLHAFDAGRAGARAFGRQLAARGVFDDPDDIFYVTLAEIAAGLPGGVSELVAFRRGRRLAHQAVSIPSAFVGVPDAQPLTDPSQRADREVIEGTGVSAGVVEGVARILDTPCAEDLNDGEVLVCRTTDPAWSTLFLIAGAAVIDVGSAMSHGAIVARELGIPCVINTKDATRKIPAGAWVRVDGQAGTVEVLGSGPSVRAP